MKYWVPNSFMIPSHIYGSPIIVDNRTFLLGLDELYRTAVKRYEQETLLPHARTLTDLLQVIPTKCPIEGYYAETPELTEYFYLVRAMQSLPAISPPDVYAPVSYQVLSAFMRSPIFGPFHESDGLLPRSHDSLFLALRETAPNWSLNRVIHTAQQVAHANDDISMVGLAARSGDSVALTALYESTVMREEITHFGFETSPHTPYVWMVDDELVESAQRFIAALNMFIPNALPTAAPEHAATFFKAFLNNDVIGRCVRIGTTTACHNRHYYWALCAATDYDGRVSIDVDIFWSDQLWTTTMYRTSQEVHVGQMQPLPMRPFQLYGVPA